MLAGGRPRPHISIEIITILATATLRRRAGRSNHSEQVVARCGFPVTAFTESAAKGARGKGQPKNKDEVKKTLVLANDQRRITVQVFWEAARVQTE